MRIVGTAAPLAAPLVEEVAHAISQGRSVLVWCDCEDVTVVLGGQGDKPAELVAVLPRLLPELVS